MRIRAAICLLSIGFAVDTIGGACAHTKNVDTDTSALNVFSLKSVEMNLSEYDRNILNIQGYVNGGVNEVPRLYPTQSAALGFTLKQAIDLFPIETALENKLSGITGVHCVILGGIFRAYTNNYFGFGQADSRYGSLQVLSIDRC